MAEVVINDKVKTHEEGNHIYVGTYKGKTFSTSMEDMNEDRKLVYREGEENFDEEEKKVIYQQLDEMTYIRPDEKGDENSVIVEKDYEDWWAFKFECYGSYGEHKFVVLEESDDNGGDATFVEGEDKFSEEEQELIYEAVNEYM
jgi:hypothetical protein